MWSITLCRDYVTDYKYDADAQRCPGPIPSLRWRLWSQQVAIQIWSDSVSAVYLYLNVCVRHCYVPSHLALPGLATNVALFVCVAVWIVARGYLTSHRPGWRSDGSCRLGVVLPRGKLHSEGTNWILVKWIDYPRACYTDVCYIIGSLHSVPLPNVVLVLSKEV